jgi:hypothetical protein
MGTKMHRRITMIENEIIQITNEPLSINRRSVKINIENDLISINYMNEMSSEQKVKLKEDVAKAFSCKKE